MRLVVFAVAGGKEDFGRAAEPGDRKISPDGVSLLLKEHRLMSIINVMLNLVTTK